MTPTSSPSEQLSVDAILKDCLTWAVMSAETALGFFRQGTAVDFKADLSPVTLADQTVEKELKAAINAKYPDHGIFGEETGIEGGDKDCLWVIDPIDGTRSFISGNPLFGMLIAFLSKGRLQAGAISMPALNEVYCGGVGVPATCNGNPIRVSGQRNLDEAVIYINEGEKLLADHPRATARLLQAGQTRRFGYDCYPHALLAAGHVDAVIDYDLKPYDFLAVSAVVEAAGGVVSDWQGKPLTLESDGAVVSAASPELHAALLKLMNS
ncbi:inositol monophosphatase family protein [Leisingera methylohalidivorans]|uniref:Inositol monophosphatase n=1 Tax=Leisingera methylohalidivorans DSM 14336 TaxID=999552 RepID=V9VZF5_9RHOB|nr:inositol monophosphatase family protein [Leisingera methylohalidivorans]AHD02257.1 inositol monophosphatase [Leisingera methylohalidivorans DSM 14336]